MNCTRARGRYLAALGLTTAVGCRLADPGTTTTTTVESVAQPIDQAPTQDAGTGNAATPPPSQSGAAPGAPHTGPWVPPADPPPPRHPGIAVCPHGVFCVPPPGDAGASPAPAPYDTCASTMAMPGTVTPGVFGHRTPTVAFDPGHTATERATDPGACCYHWNVLCVGGRALRGHDGPLTPPIARRSDWLAPVGVDAPRLSPAVRAALAAHWEREAGFEHASVAAFARASLALLAFGAPPDLVAATHAAAMDEVEHARLAYSLASTYGASRSGPGALATPSATCVASLAQLAEETLVDGCAGEAAAALVLREAAEASEDLAVRAILDRIAEDEERHAELAWRTVAWALATGGAEVARSVERAVATLQHEASGPIEGAGAVYMDLSIHGALDPAVQRIIRRRAVQEVVLPCALALLESTSSAAQA